MTEDQEIEFIIEDEKDLTTYSYISNYLCFEYFVGYEIAALLGYKNPKNIITNNVSKCNQLLFREYPGIKIPKLDPRTILITSDGAIEILLKTRKRISPDVLHILKKFNIDTTNKKCLTKEQQTLSSITNAFKTEKFEDQYKLDMYYLDLYFPEYKLCIECDENGHVDRKPCIERGRMDYVNKKLGIDDSHWIRYNPDEKDFDISKVIGKIYIKINMLKQKTEEIFEIKGIKRSVNQYTLEGKFLRTFESIENASSETGILSSNICATCRGNHDHKSAGMYLWKYNYGSIENIKPIFNESKKCVAQYTLDGKLIKVFSSVSIASKEINAFKGRHEISKACNGQLASSQGFMWRFVKDNIVLQNIEKYEYHGSSVKKIHMYKNNILVDSFYNVLDASKKTHKSRSAINNYIRGKTVDRQGYVWKNITNDDVVKFEKPKKIFVYKDNICIENFPTIMEAAKKFNKDRTTICRYIKNGIDTDGNTWGKNSSKT